MSEPFEWTVKGRVVPLRDRVLVEGMEHGETKTAGGIILGDDDGKERGIRPRWATVYAVGDEVTDVKPGDRVLIAHGRWTRGVAVVDKKHTRVVRMVELHSIMGVDES
jgi:co-chaperonin GroES (HSP10)